MEHQKIWQGQKLTIPEKDVAVQQKDIKFVNLITTIRQIGLAITISFNKTGSILVAGCTDNIKVWKIIGKPKLLRNLKGNEGCVSCIVFSKQLSWFASGGQTGTIIYWNAEGIGNQAEQKHTNLVAHLLLNNNQDELISCSHDNTIKVWKVNIKLNLITYQYTLEYIHNQDNIRISMNESETYLITSDKTIILWSKQKNRWKYLNSIENKIPVRQMCFISDYLCAYQTRQKSRIKILEIYGEKLLKRPLLNFEVQLEELDPNYGLPIIYNSKKRDINLIQQGIYFNYEKIE